MAHWLFKEEPEHYSFADLERDGQTEWDGVTNNLARANLRSVRRGDRIWFYHTGKEKAVVGEMRALADAVRGGRSDPKAVSVRVGPIRRLQRPVSLATIKRDPRLAGWDLVRLPRLSVVPTTANQWRCVDELGRGQGRGGLDARDGGPRHSETRVYETP